MVSFAGYFDAERLETVGASQPDQSEPTCESKDKTRVAVEARATMRLGKNYYEIQQGSEEHQRLSKSQLRLANAYADGTLIRVANEATVASGHGTLCLGDGSRVAIGGSTGGAYRRSVQNYVPPNYADMDLLSN